jgi:adenylosuccinate lyase
MSVFIPEGELWESKVIGEIFATKNQIECLQKAEAALARAEANLGIIPQDICDEINAKASIENIDLEEYDRQLNITGGHFVVAMLRAWKPFLSEKAAQMVHWGATTQDIMDTGDVIKLSAVYDIIYDELIQLRAILRKLAKEYIDTPMAGRTHEQHAVPTTFGLKVSVWLMEVQRHMKRMEQCRPRLRTVCFYGAAGNLASFQKGGIKVTQQMAKELDMNFSPVAWHTSRDNFIEFMTILASISTTFGKVANEIIGLSRTEIGELEEPWMPGNVGSSTMPQKRNPPGCEAMCSLAFLTQFEVGAIYRASMPENERDSRAWNVEKFVFPFTCSMTEKNLHYAIIILSKLVVNPARMRKNLDLTNGLIMCESLMMKLGARIGLMSAHEKIYQMAMEAFQKDLHLKELVTEDKEIMDIFSMDEIEEYFNPITYTGDAHEMVELALEATK